MPGLIALSVLGALSVIGVALAGFVVVIAVCFVVLRLISFVTSGAEPPPEEPAGGDPGVGEG